MESTVSSLPCKTPRKAVSVFPLTCPSCGARLEVGGDQNKFECERCGNRYLLERNIRDLAEADRNHIVPVTTYTQKMRQWFRVADVDVMLNYTGIHNTE